MQRKWDFPLYLYDGASRTCSFQMQLSASARRSRSAEGRAWAEVGIPTTPPILEAADEVSPEYRTDRAYLAVSAH